MFNQNLDRVRVLTYLYWLQAWLPRAFYIGPLLQELCATVRAFRAAIKQVLKITFLNSNLLAFSSLAETLIFSGHMVSQLTAWFATGQ